MVFASLKAGLYQAWSNKRILLAFYLLNLFAGLIIMLPFRQSLDVFMEESLMGEKLAGKIDLDFIIEFLSNTPQFIDTSIAMLVFGGLIYFALNLFLSGGAFTVFASMISRFFQINKDTLQALREAGVPDPVIKDLMVIRDEVFHDRNSFQEQLRRVLSERNIVEWGQVINYFATRHFIHRYKITDQVLAHLKSLDAPTHIYEYLKSLHGEGFHKKVRLEKYLQDFLGEGQEGWINEIITKARYRYNAETFWQGAGKHWGRFIRIALFGIAYFIVITLSLIFVKFMGEDILLGENDYQWITYWLGWMLLFLIYFIFLGTMMLVDYARIYCVINHERSALAALRQSFGFLRRHPRRPLTLAFTFSLLSIVTLIFYNPIADLFTAPSAMIILLLFIWQQLYIVGKMFLRLGLYASESYLYHHLRIATPEPLSPPNIDDSGEFVSPEPSI